MVSPCTKRHLTKSKQTASRLKHRLHRFGHLQRISLPMFGTVDTDKAWHSQVCPPAIGGTCHKMRHTLSLPTVTYICMRELSHFHHGATSSFLHSPLIQTTPNGPGFICATGQVLIWDVISHSRYSVDRSPRAFHSSTHNVV